MLLFSCPERVDRIRRQLVGTLSNRTVEVHNYPLSPGSIKVIDDHFGRLAQALVPSSLSAQAAGRQRDFQEFRGHDYHAGLPSAEARCPSLHGHMARNEVSLGDPSGELLCSPNNALPKNLEQTNARLDLERNANSLSADHWHCTADASLEAHAKSTSSKEVQTPSQRRSSGTSSLTVDTVASTPPTPCLFTPPPLSPIQKDVCNDFRQALIETPSNRAYGSGTVKSNAKSNEQADTQIWASNLRRQHAAAVLITQDAPHAQEKSMSGGTHDNLQGTQDRLLERGDETGSDMDCAHASSAPDSAWDSDVSEERSCSTTPTAEHVSGAAESSTSGDIPDSLHSTHERSLEERSEDENDADCTNALFVSESTKDLELRENELGSTSTKESSMHISSAQPTESSTAGDISRKRKVQIDQAHKSLGSPRKSRRSESNTEQMRAIPAGMAQPDAIESALCEKTKVGHNRIAILLKLFYGIGHPRWFAHLRLVCSVLRTDQQPTFAMSNGTLGQSFRLFDKLKETQAVGCVLRRYCLVDFVRRRNTQRQSRQRVPKHVLPDMIREGYPELRDTAETSPSFQCRLNTLGQALKHGRHWATLADKFGDGILTLVPVHSEFGLTNTKHIEDVTGTQFEAFLGLLEEHRGQSLYRMSKSLSGLKDLLLRRNHTSRFLFEVEGVPEDCELDSAFVQALCAEKADC